MYKTSLLLLDWRTVSFTGHFRYTQQFPTRFSRELKQLAGISHGGSMFHPQGYLGPPDLTIPLQACIEWGQF